MSELAPVARKSPENVPSKKLLKVQKEKRKRKGNDNKKESQEEG